MNIDVIFITAQILSFVGAIFFTISIVQKKKKDLMLHQIINTSAGVMSAILLQSYPAAIANFMALVRSILVRFNKDKKVIMYLLAIITLIISLCFNTRGIIGILPAIAGAEYTIALIYVKKLRSLHIVILINVILWGIHDWVVQLYPFAICDTINVIIMTISIIKETNKNNNNEVI